MRYTWGHVNTKQSCPIEVMDGIHYHIFTIEQQIGNLRHTVVLRRQQEDMAVDFQHCIRRVMIYSLQPPMFVLRQGANIHFAGSAHMHSSLADDFALYLTTFPAFVSTFCLHSS